jgi:hypothetical protein
VYVGVAALTVSAESTVEKLEVKETLSSVPTSQYSCKYTYMAAAAPIISAGQQFYITAGQQFYMTAGQQFYIAAGQQFYKI